MKDRTFLFFLHSSKFYMYLIKCIDTLFLVTSPNYLIIFEMGSYEHGEKFLEKQAVQIWQTSPNLTKLLRTKPNSKFTFLIFDMLIDFQVASRLGPISFCSKTSWNCHTKVLVAWRYASILVGKYHKMIFFLVSKIWKTNTSKMQDDHTSKMIQYQKAGIGSLIADLLQNLNKRNLKRRQKRLWAQY